MTKRGSDKGGKSVPEGSVDETSAARSLTRRDVLCTGALAGAGFAASRLPRLRPGGERVLDAARAVSVSQPGHLSDIEHVVILMQENRSFDHYFGTMSGVRGFDDSRALVQKVGNDDYPIFDQFGYQPGIGPDAGGYLQPFRLVSNPPTVDGQTTNDITHDWGPQHLSWNGGAMDDFVRVHLAADGATNGFLTMGYYNRNDLPFYYALADAFTVCDMYFCSVLGPTDPNRVMSISASLDPSGAAGGPVLQTYVQDRPQHYGSFGWETMPERLSASGITWKVYQDPTGSSVLSPFPYFRVYAQPSSPSEVALADRALAPQYPVEFDADVASGNLPSVSWIIPPLYACEHPATPPEYGENLVQNILSTLVANPDVWSSTVLFVVYDENGGFFDHVPPPTPPHGTEGEFLSVSPLPAAADGIAGPIGLGFRTPCLVVSPYSSGGYRCSETFDHTSLLRFLEARFGVAVPNLSSWRRSATGDLTTSLDLIHAPDPIVPPLPPTSLLYPDVAEQAFMNSLLGTVDEGEPYPPPTSDSMPTQESTPIRRPRP